MRLGTSVPLLLAATVLLLGGQAVHGQDPMNAWHYAFNQEPAGQSMRWPQFVTDAVESVQIFVGIYPQHTVWSGECYFREQGAAEWESVALAWYINEGNNEYWAATIPNGFSAGDLVEYYIRLEEGTGSYCTTYVCGGDTHSRATCDEQEAWAEPFRFRVYYLAPEEITVDTEWSTFTLLMHTAWIRPGARLTIAAGAEVHALTDVDLMIEGELIARGTEDALIRFTSAWPNPAPGFWGSVKFLETSTPAQFTPGGEYQSGCILEYCELMYGRPAVVCERCSPYIHGCDIHHNRAIHGGGINVSGGAGIIADCAVHDNIAGMGDNTPAYGGGLFLSGFSGTVSGCRVTDNEGYSYNVAARGGGIFISGGPAVIENCVISGSLLRGDTVSSRGGGIYTDGEGVVIRDCTIAGNSAYGYHGSAVGGGIASDALAYIQDCVIIGNTTAVAGGIHAGAGTEVLRCLIQENTATSGYISSGGGVQLDGGAIRGCHITGNYAQSGSGMTGWDGVAVDCLIDYNDGLSAVAAAYGTGELTFHNCLIQSNYCGGMSLNSGHVTVTNCLIAHNGGEQTGGGIGGGAFIEVVNSTIADNDGPGFSATMAPLLVNTIITGHSADIPPYYPETSIDHCNFGDGNYLGINGTISCDPMFVAPGALDYHLTWESCCRDAGTNDDVPPFDFDGDPRPDPFSGMTDIGFDEILDEVPPSSTPTPEPTYTATPTVPPTYSPSPTPGWTATPTPSSSGTPEPTDTPTPWPTATPTWTATPSPGPGTPTATPSLTPSPRPTATATHTPASSPTPTGTHTPVSSPTPTATPFNTATATPEPSPSLQFELDMPRHDYQAGDACYLDAIIERSGPAIPQAALVVLLDAGTGSYWFYPTWREYPPELDYETITVAAGRSQFTIIPEFTWPAGAGSSDGFNLAFFGAILDSSVTALVSNLDSWTFEYR